MIISKPAIIFHISQIFFNFLAMACFASVASFQAKWGIGPCKFITSTAGLTGFAIFVSISGIFLAVFLLFVPVVYEKYDKLIRLARALKEVRVGFILVGSGCIFSLLIACVFILPPLISVLTSGCTDLSPPSQRGQRLGAKTRITILMQALATRLRAVSLVGAVRRKQALYSFGWRLVRFPCLIPLHSFIPRCHSRLLARIPYLAYH
jgi:hypothetical protein